MLRPVSKIVPGHLLPQTHLQARRDCRHGRGAVNLPEILTAGGILHGVDCLFLG